MRNIYLDGMMGLVVGDACGVPVEFMSREELSENPVTGMRAYGTHQQPKGTWSDDSSMALATLASLRQGYDLKDIAEQFSRWDQEEIYTPFGELFDIGMTCSRAIENYQNSGNPKTCGLSGEQDNGNGSLMRILPMCLYVYDRQKRDQLSEADAVTMIHEVSAITHAHLRSRMACGLFYFCVKNILDGREIDSLEQCLQQGFDEGFGYYLSNPENIEEMQYFSRLKNIKAFYDCSENTIHSTGYVVDAFEAAIWALIHTDSYEACILRAVNLGDDTDTIAAIAGGLAGLFYGYENIPQNFKGCIIRREWIEALCENRW